MRKHFDYLRRSTFFLFGNGEFDRSAVLNFCTKYGFGHLMISGTRWYRTAGWYESCWARGYCELKAFIGEAHRQNIIVSLHGHAARIYHDDPYNFDPIPVGLIDGWDPQIWPYGVLQKQISARFVQIADLVNTDGLYLDGAEKVPEVEGKDKMDVIADVQETVISQLTRSMILQTSATTERFRDYWCLRGQRDRYDFALESGFVGTRNDWNNEYIKSAAWVLTTEYQPQLGWLDFAHGKKTKAGASIEDQTPESLSTLCSWAREHNVPVVLESDLEEINSHPLKDELLEIIRGK